MKCGDMDYNETIVNIIFWNGFTCNVKTKFKIRVGYKNNPVIFSGRKSDPKTMNKNGWYVCLSIQNYYLSHQQFFSFHKTTCVLREYPICYFGALVCVNSIMFTEEYGCLRSYGINK